MAAINLISGPTIAAGASLSGILDCSAALQGIKRILMPPAWTSAWLSFQISPDGTTFQDLYWPNGVMVVVTVVPAARSSPTQPVAFGVLQVSIRDDSEPIVQPQARAFKCVVQGWSNEP